MKRRKEPVILLALAVSSTLLAVWAVKTWQASHTPELVSRYQAAETLRSLLYQEKAYLREARAFAPGLEELGINPPPGPWEYQVVTARVDDKPLLLLNARNGRELLTMDEEGVLRHQQLAAPEGLAPWVPAGGGGHE